ncbi:unnamed protein product, partial [Coregonus sp. 'balchen']
MKGLMPAELRQELEDTISSLKSQVNFLQKRASVLQEDLDACHSRRLWSTITMVIILTTVVEKQEAE